MEVRMESNFCEVKLFQVRPDRLEEFVVFAEKAKESQAKCLGCSDMKYMKRFYVHDEIGTLPRELTKIVKCVKYYSYWEFDTIENYTAANLWFFDNYEKELRKLLITPFDINCGYGL
jgi:hypothetical protein